MATKVKKNKVTVIKRPEGRPTKYDPKYCKKLIEFQADGFSLAAFAGEIGIHIDTVYEWAKQHPEFSEAKKIAEYKCQLFWEKLGMQGVKGEILGFGASTWIFNMKNRFKWKDNLDVVTTDNTPKPDRKELAQRLLDAIKIADDFR